MMKFSTFVTTFVLLASKTDAFTFLNHGSNSDIRIFKTSLKSSMGHFPPSGTGISYQGSMEGLNEPSGLDDLFPEVLPMETIAGGNAVRTYKLPPNAERAQYMLKSNGRPLKATVEVLFGPIRTLHILKIDNMNGQVNPVRGTIKFKSGVDPIVRITTSDHAEFPVIAGLYIPTPERSEEIGKITETVFQSSPKQLCQGGGAGGGPGSVRTFHIPPDVDAVQMICWSKDVGKWGLKTHIEILQGPNCQRQKYYLSCGGSTQPHHAIYEVPGAGWEIRIKNDKVLEVGHFEACVVPYDLKTGGSGRVYAIPNAASKPWYQ